MLVTVNATDRRQHNAVQDVLAERRFQDSQFGEQNHDLAWWLVILGEEYGEACQATCDWRWGKTRIDDIRKELIQTAAVALAAVECIDRGEWTEQITTAMPSDKRQLAMALGRGDEDRYSNVADDEPDPSLVSPDGVEAHEHHFFYGKCSHIGCQARDPHA